MTSPNKENNTRLWYVVYTDDKRFNSVRCDKPILKYKSKTNCMRAIRILETEEASWAESGYEIVDGGNNSYHMVAHTEDVEVLEDNSSDVFDFIHSGEEYDYYEEKLRAMIVDKLGITTERYCMERFELIEKQLEGEDNQELEELEEEPEFF